jgi:hypothetical protein
MSTSAQLTANRANARHSTGPRTESGKLASSRNSLRHGLTAKQIVIPGEDPAEFDTLRQELHEDYTPANTAEATLVDHIAEHTWRLQRARRAEAAMFERLMRDNETDRAIAAALVDPHGDLEKIRRYEVTIERSYYRAIEQLRKMQKERRAQAEAESGFVSQSPGERAGAILEALYNFTPAVPQSSASTGFVSQEPATPDAA